MAETPATPLAAQPASTQIARPPLPFHAENITQLWEVAIKLSKAGLAPEAIRDKPEDCFLVLMSGRDLGLSPTESFRALVSIKGKLAMYTQFKLAKAQAHPDLEYLRLVESTDKKATWEGKRKSQAKPFPPMTFTIEEAQRAGLTGKDTWKNYPAHMLRWRAASALIDIMLPDAFYGFSSAEEIADLPERTVEAIGTPVTTTRRPDVGSALQLGQEMANGNGHSNGKPKDEGHDPITGEVREPVVEPVPTEATPQELADDIIEKLKRATTKQDVAAQVQRYKKLPADLQAVCKAEAMAMSEKITPPKQQEAAAEPGSAG